MQDRECIVFERTRDTDQRIQEPCPVLIPSSTNSRWIIFILRDICAFARWNFLLHAAKQNNKAAKFFVSLEENNSEGFNGAPKILLALRELSCGSQPRAPTCIVWNWHLKDSPLLKRVLYKEFFPVIGRRQNLRPWLALSA